MAGGRRDVEGVRSGVDEFDTPAGHFARLVAARAGAAAIGKGGWSAVDVAGDVVDMPDGRVAERIPAGLVPQLDEVASQPSN